MQRKQIPIILCCIILLVISLLGLSGCGGGGGGHDDDSTPDGSGAIAYRLVKIESHDMESSDDDHTTIITYDTNGNPTREVMTSVADGEEIINLTVEFKDGKLDNVKGNNSDGSDPQTTDYEYGSAGELISVTNTRTSRSRTCTIAYVNGKRTTWTEIDTSDPDYKGYGKYEYDGKRISKIINTDDAGIPSIERDFEYDSNGNLAKATFYDKKDNKKISDSVFTWEKADSTINWNFVLLVP